MTTHAVPHSVRRVYATHETVARYTCPDDAKRAYHRDIDAEALVVEFRVGGALLAYRRAHATITAV